MYVPNHLNLQLTLLQSSHNHHLAGHPGATKTTQMLQRKYYWPNILHDITQCRAWKWLVKRTTTNYPQSNRTSWSSRWVKEYPIKERAERMTWNSVKGMRRDWILEDRLIGRMPILLFTPKCQSELVVWGETFCISWPFEPVFIYIGDLLTKHVCNMFHLGLVIN